MASVRSEVLNIAYTEIGDGRGRAVFLVHGWPDAARGWSQLAHDLAGRGYRVIMPDNRGTGGTHLPVVGNGA